MIRTTIQLTEEQSRRLRKMATDEGVSLSELIRRCFDRHARPEAGLPRAVRYLEDIAGDLIA